MTDNNNKILCFDIETNGLLEDVTAVHCIVIQDVMTGEVYRFTPDNIEEGIKMLQGALNDNVTIAGHNIICFDIPALHKVYPDLFNISREQRHLVVDTLVLSRLIYPNRKDLDTGLVIHGKLPKKYKGSHSLAAWGYRLQNNKGTYATDTGEGCWDTFNTDMLDYCTQDVNLNVDLLKKLLSKNYSQRAIQLEHEVQWLMFKQEQNGFNFEIDKARELEGKLRERHAVLQLELMDKVPPIPDKVVVPKRDNKAKGYKKGVPIQRYKEFNPNSRKQIEWLYREHFKYLPLEVTCYDTKKDDVSDLTPAEVAEKYRLKIEAETFAFIKKDTKRASEEVRHLSEILEEFLLISKRLGQLADGKYAWLKMVNTKDSCIHGRVNPNGTVSGRAAHSSPNVAQVPAVDAPYGEECRELFTVPKGWVQVGVDACGLELRCLAHFLAPYDDGAYGHTILNGDIHTMNQQAAGLPTRALAKRFIYAYL